MGWGTEFQAEIYLSRENYEDILQVERELADTKKYSNWLKTRIYMYASSGPSGVSTKDDEGFECNPIECLHIELDKLFDEYSKSIIKEHELELLKEDWDDENKKFKTADLV